MIDVSLEFFAQSSVLVSRLFQMFRQAESKVEDVQFMKVTTMEN